MTEQDKINILGEYYVPFTNSRKKKYIDAINGFINKYKDFKPTKNGYYDFKPIKTFVEANGMTLLDKYMFANYEDIVEYTNGRVFFAEVACDTNGVKHIIFYKKNIKNAKIIDESLSLSDLAVLYDVFVYNVNDTLSIIKLFREIEIFFNNAKYPMYFLVNTSSTHKYCEIIKDAKFDVSTHTLKLNVSKYILTNTLSSDIMYDLKCNTSTSNITEITIKYMNERNIVTREKIIEILNQAFDNKTKELQTARCEVLNSIE